MNWLKTLWNWLIRKTSTSPKLTIAEEEPTPCVVEKEPSIEELFLEVCADIGVGAKIINSTNAVEKFEDWYTGQANKESILDSLKEFMKTDGTINAKLQGLVK